MEMVRISMSFFIKHWKEKVNTCKSLVFIRYDCFFYFYIINIPIFRIDVWPPSVKTEISGSTEIDNLASLNLYRREHKTE